MHDEEVLLQLLTMSDEEYRQSMWDTIHERFQDGNIRGAERVACQYEAEFGGRFCFSGLGVRYES